MEQKNPFETKTPMRRWREAGRTPVGWGSGVASGRRTFDEDLALFERQALAETAGEVPGWENEKTLTPV